jgi:L-ascorbate metabolism protein UlaG (beta-lactamase superfamily)
MRGAQVTAMVAVLVLSVGCVSAKPEAKKQDAPGKPPDFTEGVWIKKYPGNYACFKFETPDGITIVCDPFGMDEKVSADIVTESHQDYDHVDTSMITGLYKLYQGPGEFSGEFAGEGIFVAGIGGKHNKTDAEVTNTVFVFAINGIRIAHFASLGQAPSEEMWAKLNELGGIDVLLIQAYTNPVWKSVKMTLEECCSVVDRLDPRIVIPEHGNMGISEDIARHFHTQVQHEGYGGFVVTKGLLRSISGHRILDMDTTSRLQ